MLSLYRRHRPRTFEEVVGQEHIVRTLRNAIELGKVHHAYLFVGSRGTGKTSMAKLLACALNAEDGPRADFSPDDPSARARLASNRGLTAPPRIQTYQSLSAFRRSPLESGAYLTIATA